MIEEILTIDWEQVRLKRAISGVVAMLLVVAFIGAAGDIVMTVALAAVFTISASGDGPMAFRWIPMLRFIAFGAAIGFLAFAAIDSGWAIAIVLGLAAYVGTLAAAFGLRSARAGLFLTIWTLFAILIGSTDTEPLAVSVSFIIGGAVAILVTAIRLAMSTEDDADDEASDVAEPSAGDIGDGSILNRLASAARGPIGQFAIVRTFAVVAAVLLGFWWFSSYPLWAAMTVIIVVKPSSNQTASIAVQRTLGTGIGAALAIVVAQAFPRTDAGVAIAFLVSAALMVAFMNANYTLMAVFLTAMLVFSQRLAQADAFEAGWERLLATALGGAVSLAVVWYALERRKRRDTSVA